MSESIAFTDIDVSASGVLRCTVTREDSQELSIRLPYSFVPSPDLIAAAFAAMCGTKFDAVRIDLPLGEEQVQRLQEALGAKIWHRPGSDVRRHPGTNTGLNFSGGFDSLAAREMISDAHLISLDFGGRFSREANFFHMFFPLTFETNLTELRLNRYSWQFMGIGSILLRDELALRHYAFGSILAGSLDRLHTSPHPGLAVGIPAANYFGMSLVNPVAGISEVASMQIVARNSPEMLVEVLKSVALPKEDKFQRKHQMLQAVTSHLNLPIALPELPQRVNQLPWGASFATDLSSLYLMQQLGVEHVAASYADGVPDKVLETVDELDLSFMLRFNPHAYESYGSSDVARWCGGLLENGIRPYLRKDWDEVRRAVDLLKA